MLNVDPRMDAEAYRRLQRVAVTGHTGTTVWEILLVTLWIPAALFLYNSVVRRWAAGQDDAVRVLVESIILIVPQVLLFLWPHLARFLYLSALIPAFTWWYYSPQRPAGRATASTHLPFVTNSRAAIMIMCIIGILAVDFQTFPRRFAKTESFGTSLMDVGVGCVVVSLGITAARSYMRDRVRMWEAMKSTAPLLALGVTRMVLVKGIQYQEHASEYGVHWNFFVTLGLLPMLMRLLYWIVPPRHSFGAGLALGMIHQIVLLCGGMQNWVVNQTTRGSSLVELNKEGIVSLAGYLSLAVTSVGLGYGFFTERDFRTKLGILLTKVAALSVLYFVLTEVLQLTPSRRLANFPFVVGSILLTAIQMAGYLILERLDPSCPMVFSGVSRNQLALFLLANVMTGLVNLSCFTLLQPDWIALSILLPYVLVVVVIGAILHQWNITLRL